MTLRFIGIDPNTGTGESPTVWVDNSNNDLVIQGWKPTPELEARCASFEVPGHAAGIPEHEAVIRIPARMVPILRKACDAAEGTELR
ncbi:hypothetical protein JBE04_25085 [Streptomyces sp. PRKS01-29]|uniref:hypothetical protein n=1 Tax=Streptomyces antimycoticus TaxID=68175 RepID=UPI0018DD53D1|nr:MULTISPECIES: hypothetical protein [Streptomyces]MBI0297647.1 hypothetical protein [Streptomyces sabulosicollis]WJD99786.1 hypothetical protein QR300_29475 [Streptomyces antimycoticus]